MYVGQAEIATCVSKSQPLVINSEQMQDRGVQVMHVHAIV
jgi:hypothetical protein